MMSRALASLSARRVSAFRRSSSTTATTMRLATEMAKFCSSTVHSLAVPTCSAHSTPTVRVILAERNIEHGADVLGCQVAVQELTRARVGPGVLCRDDALALERVEICGSVLTM